MTNHYLHDKIAIWKWFVHYFKSYLHENYCSFSTILLTTYKRILLRLTIWRENTSFSGQWLEKKRTRFLHYNTDLIRINSMRFLNCLTFLWRFIPTLVLPDCLTGRNTSKAGGCSKQHQTQYLDNVKIEYYQNLKDQKNLNQKVKIAILKYH